MEVGIWTFIMWLCKFPGALVLHALSRFKRPVDYYMNHKNSYGVSLVGFAVILCVVYIFTR
jgi:hypothetical protein